MFTVAATTKPFEPTFADLNSFEGITDRVAARGLATRDDDDDADLSDDDADLSDDEIDDFLATR